MKKVYKKARCGNTRLKPKLTAYEKNLITTVFLYLLTLCLLFPFYLKLPLGFR